jgi:hypothetical protein
MMVASRAACWLVIMTSTSAPQARPVDGDDGNVVNAFGVECRVAAGYRDDQ